MKTIEQFYNELVANDDLKIALADAIQNGALGGFLADEGVDGTADDFREYWFEQLAAAAELSEEQLEAVAGGAISGLPFFSVRPDGTECHFPGPSSIIGMIVLPGQELPLCAR